MIKMVENGKVVEEMNPRDAALSLAFYFEKNGKKQQQIQVDSHQDLITFSLDGVGSKTVRVKCKTDYLLLLGYLKEYLDLEAYDESYVENLPLMAL